MNVIILGIGYTNIQNINTLSLIIAKNKPCCSLPLLRRGPLVKESLFDLFYPTLDLPLGGFGKKTTTTIVRDHGYFIPTKFRKYPSSDSLVKADYVFPYIYMH